MQFGLLQGSLVCPGDSFLQQLSIYQLNVKEKKSKKHLQQTPRMACGSGCCGGATKEPPASTVLLAPEPAPTPAVQPEPVEQKVGEAVDNGVTTNTADDCCADDGCSTPAVKDSCCAPVSDVKPVEAPKPASGCKSACCSSPPAAAPVVDDAPSCCQGKKAPCCDTSCIDRLALRECQAGDYAISEGMSFIHPPRASAHTTSRTGRFQVCQLQRLLPRTRRQGLSAPLALCSRVLSGQARCPRLHLPRPPCPGPGVLLPA
jgi:hypothetical protein